VSQFKTTRSARCSAYQRNSRSQIFPQQISETRAVHKDSVIARIKERRRRLQRPVAVAGEASGSQSQALTREGEGSSQNSFVSLDGDSSTLGEAGGHSQVEEDGDFEQTDESQPA
jgi:hypothetical protein